jgi:hypothetical protein
MSKEAPPTSEELRTWVDLTLDQWADLPLAELHRAERHFWGRPLSTARAQRDTPYSRSKRSPKLTRPTKRDIAELEADQPAYPDGDPDPRWSDAELAAFMAHQDVQLAVQPAPEQSTRWEELSDSQLDDLSAGPPAPTKRKRSRCDGEPTDVVNLCVNTYTGKEITMAWSDRVSAEVASRRAGGRRRYHALRRDLATVRRHRVGQLVRAYGRQRGVQARIAKELKVSEATVSRDIAFLLDQARAG